MRKGMFAGSLPALLAMLCFPVAPAIGEWLVDGLGNPVDRQGNPIPSAYVDMASLIELETGLDRGLSIGIAETLFEEDKLLSRYGPLSGNDPHEVNLVSVAGLLAERTGLPREEIEELLHLLEPSGLLPF